MTPLPGWVTEIRPAQRTAVTEIVDAFNCGAKVVFFEGPTGTGKTLIGELVRRQLRTPGVYVCSSLTLQDQTLHDFPYARVLKGRSNYPTLVKNYTAADCTGPGCLLCGNLDRGDPDFEEQCSYRIAKMEALTSQLAVLNTTYLLFEANLVGSFTKLPFVIADECDQLESELMKFVELRLSSKAFRLLEVEPPKDGQHYKTISAHLMGPVRAAAKAKLSRAITGQAPLEEQQELASILTAIDRTGHMIANGNWVREKLKGGLVMKPITVAPFAQDVFWKHGKRWLCMSATIINARVMARELGLADHEWEFVSAPMGFPVENRPIHLGLVADMKRANIDQGVVDASLAIETILEAHVGERVLIHAVSYDLTRMLASRVRTNREVLYYTSARERAGKLAQFLTTPDAVLIAPSMDRGVDLADDACRVMVIAKVPYPNLGDKQVSSKLNADGGQLWYATETIRTIVQMTGRGVRSDTDHATTYILDAQFRRLWQQHKQSFPKWWRDAVNPAFRFSDLTPTIKAHYRAEG